MDGDEDFKVLSRLVGTLGWMKSLGNLEQSNSYYALKSGETKECLAKGIPRMNLTGHKVTCLWLSALGTE